ncbi:MAG: dihydroneopterin aldolase [Bacteroides sp.]|jgi:dihydroneopterin aldolase|nr:dihydroneopterin aldolase [Bacteroides sp.]
MGKIILEQMEFYAYHGCFHEEQIIGNPFIVHLELEASTIAAETSDKLEDAINYQEVYNLVRQEMEIKSHLLEHVARRIIDAVTDAYPSIIGIKVRISKMNPPIGRKMHAVSVELSR